MRWLIDTATLLLGRLRRGRRVPVSADPTDGRVKVNLGCGLAVAPGWINVDASLNAVLANLPRALLPLAYRLSGSNRYYSREQYIELLSGHRFVHHDLAHSLPFADASVDVVYSSHFVEHLFRDEAIVLMRESLRILRPGGLVRVCVPDLAWAVERYRQGHKREMLEQYFFVEDRSSFLARHKYMYDFDLMRETLEAAGFTEVQRCTYREGSAPDLSLLDNRPEETLFVEAVRPLASQRIGLPVTATR
jgi:predicted SAM-dependent methyltransferase